MNISHILTARFPGFRNASIARCDEYHKDKPANDSLERAATHLFPGVVPDGMKVTIFAGGRRPAVLISTPAIF